LQVQQNFSRHVKKKPKRRLAAMDGTWQNFIYNVNDDINISKFWVCHGQIWQCWGEESQMVCEKDGDYD
jgi:hypothetical protein